MLPGEDHLLGVHYFAVYQQAVEVDHSHQMQKGRSNAPAFGNEYDKS
jgi:hypothetical protein